MKKRSKYISNYGNKKLTFYKKYIETFENQFIIVLVLLGVVMLFNAVNIPITNTFINGTKAVLNYNMDYENAKKGLKLVEKQFPVLKDNVVKVFSTNNDMQNVPVEKTDKMISPVNGIITSGFGERVDPISNKVVKHDGIDIEVPIGKDVKAVLDGTVMIAEDNNGDFGKLIVLQHNNNLRTVYAHLSEIDVVVGEKIKQGDVIGKTGNTGKTTAPHLHFEIWEDGKPIDPLTKIAIIGSIDSENK